MGSSCSSSPETIKIGAVLPLTGDMSHVGQTNQKALQLALEQLPVGRYKYEAVFEDGKMDSAASLSAAAKLVEVDGVSALITIGSNAGSVVSPYAESNKVIHIGMASNPLIASGRYNFIHQTLPPEETKLFASELHSRGLKRVAILVLNQQGTIAIADDLKRRLNGTEATVVFEDVHDKGTTDFKSILLKAEAAKPDIYLLETFSPEVEILKKQMDEMGITVPVSGIQSIEFSKQPSLFEGVWYVSTADVNDNFRDEYYGRWGEQPGFVAGNSYDALKLIVNAFEKSSSKEGAVSELAGTRGFNGALGELNVLEDGIVSSKATVRQVVNGTFVTVR